MRAPGERYGRRIPVWCYGTVWGDWPEHVYEWLTSSYSSTPIRRCYFQGRIRHGRFDVFCIEKGDSGRENWFRPHYVGECYPKKEGSVVTGVIAILEDSKSFGPSPFHCCSSPSVSERVRTRSACGVRVRPHSQFLVSPQSQCFGQPWDDIPRNVLSIFPGGFDRRSDRATRGLGPQNTTNGSPSSPEVWDGSSEGGGSRLVRQVGARLLHGWTLHRSRQPRQRRHKASQHSPRCCALVRCFHRRRGRRKDMGVPDQSVHRCSGTT